MKQFISFTKISTLLFVLALLTLGVIYGQWTETLVINGSATTGEVDVNFTRFGCYDDENLAAIGAVLTDPNTIQVSVSNGYPGYLGHCWADYNVAGSIPVYLKAIDFTAGNNLTNCVYSTYNAHTGSFTATCDQLEVEWSDGLCTYFDIGEGEGFNMHMTVLPGAGETTPYDFTVAYTFEQANASSCP